MASGAQQLVADYEQVRKLLDLYPDIRIIATEGEPPERYDIEYTVKGYRTDEDGTASPVNSHRIRITIPFGYPHFPPTVKPLSSIFHPDIDPDAIRIADFWQNNQSLADLILHIGHMICGSIYQKEEPFNQDAFAWYEKRQSWLPFDTLEPRDGEDQGTDVQPDDSAASGGTEQEETSDAKISSGKTLDILKDDLIFPFDDDDLAGETPETTPEEPTPLEDVEEDMFVDLAEEEEELSFSLEIDETGEQEDSETDDLGGDGEDETLLSMGNDEEFEQGLSLDSLLEEETAQSHEAERPEEEEQAEELEKIEAEDIPLVFESEDKNSTEDADIPLQMDSDKPEGTGDADTAPGLDDASLAGLELSDEEPQEEPDEMSGGGEARSIQPLLEQKEIYTASKVIADISDQASIPNLEEMQKTIASAISEAEELYKKADKLEQAGELEKAGLTLDLVANIAVDYPGLEFARNRIREAMISGEGRKEEAEPSGEKDDEGKSGKKKKGPRLGAKLPYKIIALVLILAVILAGAASVVIRDTNSIKAASSHFRKAEQLLAKKEFKQARKSLNGATAALDSILFLKQDEKDILQKKIRAIVDSQSFKEGVKGRVLYDGNYVTVEKAKEIDKFNALVQRAEAKQGSGDIERAIELYELAIESSRKIGFAEWGKNIRQIINSLRLNQALEAARKAEEEQEWKKAADTYSKALEMSKTLSTPDNNNEIATRLAAATFRHELLQGQEAFTAANWQETIAMLERAQHILAANPEVASAAEKREINRLLVNSRLYHILSGAKDAFEKQEWEKAIQEYEGAISLLEDNRDLLGGSVPDSIEKIRKTILMTQISREQNLNALAVEKKDAEASLKSYQTINDLISTSPFQEDETLGKILKNARDMTDTLAYEIKINRRIDWLTEHYEEIFRKMYPSAKSSELLRPQADFIREENGRLLFKVACVEKRQGRSFRLELNYQYDPKTDSWDIYSGKL